VTEEKPAVEPDDAYEPDGEPDDELEPDDASEAIAEDPGVAEDPEDIGDTPQGARRRRRERARARREEGDESLTARLIAQWVQLREERQEQLASPLPLASTAQRRTEVPYGVELAASWAWRFLVIVAAAAVLMWVVGYLSLIVVPVVIAMLVTALVAPVVTVLTWWRVPKSASSLIATLGVIGVIVLMLTFATRQVAAGAEDMADQVVRALDDTRSWLRDGPLHASDTQINSWIDSTQDSVTALAQQGNPLGRIADVGGIAMDIVAGLFIVIFGTFFFLAEGDRIWSWVVRLTPRAARERIDSSGRVAWVSLTQFIRATVIVAAVDAIGIMAAAAILQVPFVAAIGVLVFLGGFVPLLGATVAGTLAVLVALLDQGLIVALIMLGAVILVNQLEAHLLQPFLMGKWVAVHPLAVILAIATGVIVAGVAGALVAVPLAAALNAVALHLSAGPAPAEDDPGGPEEAGEQAPLADDPGPYTSTERADA